jgi:hypothetical protein
VAQVLREKDFPVGSFLTTQLGRSISLAWISLYGARVVLEGGLHWRVGNGVCNKLFFFFFFENINKSSQWHENMSLSQHTVHIP